MPAVLFKHYGQNLIVWLWARALDDSWQKHGENLRQGRITFRLSALAASLNRSVSTVRRWLAGARDKGLIWRFYTTGDLCRLWYGSLKRVAVQAGVSDLGAVAWIQVSDLCDLRIKATDLRISELCRAHSAAMASGRAPFSHEGFELRVKAIGKQISYGSAAENLAYNFGYSAPVKQAVKGWIKSAGHRNNMEWQFDLTGVCIVQNAKGEYYFTQIFICRW